MTRHAVNTVRRAEAAMGGRGEWHRFTVADLPLTDDPQTLFGFCEQAAGPLRWRAWQGGRLEREGNIYYSVSASDDMNPFGKLYVGRSLLEARQTLLAWLNARKDTPLARLGKTAWYAFHKSI